MTQEEPPSARATSSKPDLRPSTDKLIEREQALIDALLVRFKNIIELAAMPSGDLTKELVAAQTFQMKVESAALVRFYILEEKMWLTESRSARQRTCSS